MEVDQKSFERLGVTYKEKVFFDILVAVRDKHAFSYADEKCLALARAINKLVDESEVIVLLYLKR